MCCILWSNYKVFTCGEVEVLRAASCSSPPLVSLRHKQTNSCLCNICWAAAARRLRSMINESDRQAAVSADATARLPLHPLRAVSKQERLTFNPERDFNESKTSEWSFTFYISPVCTSTNTNPPPSPPITAVRKQLPLLFTARYCNREETCEVLNQKNTKLILKVFSLRETLIWDLVWE